MAITITPLGAALGAVVEGVTVDPDHGVDPSVAADLHEAWHRHLVLFFPQLALSPAQQVAFARTFGPRIEATTEAGSDYRNAASLMAEGYPQLLVLDTDEKLNPATTAQWHTDVTFIDNPPIGSLFSMHIPARTGGDTMWSNQYRAYERLSSAVKELIGKLSAEHGRPPRTGTAVHPLVKIHPATGQPCLFVNRGWTNRIVGVSPAENRHLLAMLLEVAETPELQMRWKWTAGDVALWDNRCTMHYALNDYQGERRRAVRATIYEN